MTLDTAFRLANLRALVGWIALMLAPLRRPAMVFIARAIGVLLAIGYTIGFVTAIGAARGLVGDYSLTGIAAFFADPRLALVGWVHYLAFDLWVGAWEVDAAERAAMPHALVVPALLLTFLVGPVGLIAFLALRAIGGRRKPRRFAS